jgi:hypothetical protein
MHASHIGRVYAAARCAVDLRKERQRDRDGERGREREREREREGGRERCAHTSVHHSYYSDRRAGYTCACKRVLIDGGRALACRSNEPDELGMQSSLTAIADTIIPAE